MGILGSPRRGGNSEILLDKALEGVKAKGADTDKIVLNELKFVPCQECGGCARSGRCVIDDDFQLIYKKIDQAGALIISSPIFFGSLSAQVKAMIDRYQCAWQAKYVLGKSLAKAGKKGALMLVSASDREKFFQNAESIVKNFFAVLEIKFQDKLYCPNVDEKAKILSYPDCLKRALALGENI